MKTITRIISSEPAKPAFGYRCYKITAECSDGSVLLFERVAEDMPGNGCPSIASLQQTYASHPQLASRSDAFPIIITAMMQGGEECEYRIRGVLYKGRATTMTRSGMPGHEWGVEVSGACPDVAAYVFENDDMAMERARLGCSAGWCSGYHAEIRSAAESLGLIVHGATASPK